MWKPQNVSLKKQEFIILYKTANAKRGCDTPQWRPQEKVDFAQGGQNFGAYAWPAAGDFD